MDQTKEVLRTVCEAIEEKKGDRVLVLDISGVSSFTDFFVLCQGFNQRQNQAICDSVKERLKREIDLAPSHIEGYDAAEWILMDYLSFVVHIFSPEAREFYKLERLWGDGVRLDEAALSA
jgi:ribosome-associated protein